MLHLSEGIKSELAGNVFKFSLGLLSYNWKYLFDASSANSLTVDSLSIKTHSDLSSIFTVKFKIFSFMGRWINGNVVRGSAVKTEIPEGADAGEASDLFWDDWSAAPEKYKLEHFNFTKKLTMWSKYVNSKKSRPKKTSWNQSSNLFHAIFWNIFHRN